MTRDVLHSMKGARVIHVPSEFSMMREVLPAMIDHAPKLSIGINKGEAAVDKCDGRRQGKWKEWQE